MNCPSLTKTIAATALLALAVSVAPAAELEERSVERTLRLSGLQVMPLNAVNIMVGALAGGQEQCGYYATMAVPQRLENNNPSKSSAVHSPGTDATVYVPGSTAQPFSQLDAFKLGRLMLRPSARLTYGYNSNYLNLSGYVLNIPLLPCRTFD